MYDVLGLSRYIVRKCIDDGCPVSNVQLQKILWCVQKEFLGRGAPAFPDDMEEWRFGPVVPGVFYHYCGHGAMPIAFVNCPVEMPEIRDCDAGILDRVIEERRLLRPWEWRDVLQWRGEPKGREETPCCAVRGARAGCSFPAAGGKF